MWKYDRIRRNRRDAALVAVMLLGVLAPVALGGGFLVSTSVLGAMSSQTRHLKADAHALEEALDGERAHGQSPAWLEQSLARQRAALARSTARDRAVILLVSAMLGAGLIAVLMFALLTANWSPTTRLLTHLGALPSGNGHPGVTLLLQDLATQAGLPVPKLYIINVGVPSMFADGTDPHNAAIAITRGTLNLLDQRELAGLLAHQLSHIANHDIELNALLAPVTLFVSFPYLLLRGQLFPEGRLAKTRAIFALAQFLLSPLALYVFLVAPLLIRLIRIMVTRDREFQADADAVSLTNDPAGLLSALAKVQGANAAAAHMTTPFAHSCLSDPRATGGRVDAGLGATHPPLTKRIDRLAERHGFSDVEALQSSVDRGREYAAQHQDSVDDLLLSPHDPLAALNQGNVMGKVYRVVSNEAVPVLESDEPEARPVARVQPGELLVAFGGMGRMREVNTAGEVFGYIDRKVKLKAVAGVVPQEIYQSTLRAAAEITPERRGGGRMEVTLGVVAAVMIGVTVVLVALWR